MRMLFVRRYWWLGAILVIALVALWTRYRDSEDVTGKRSGTPLSFSQPSGGKGSASPPATPSPKPLPITPSLKSLRIDFKRVWEDFLERRKEMFQYGDGNSRFEKEKLRLLREARLFALAYPEEAQKLALPVALDSTRDWLERCYAVDVLGFLAKNGSTEALSALLSLGRDGDVRVSDTAIQGLSMSDPDGKYKDLYFERCRAGSYEAFEIVSAWCDPGTISEMKSYLGGPNEDDAAEVLRRMDVLASGNWEEQIIGILRRQSTTLLHPFDWAMEVMKRRDPSTLRQVLRDQLDQALTGGRNFWEEFHVSKRFEDAFPSQPNIGKEVGNRRYDDLLVAYWGLGGELKDLERARLREFGYACNPGERLAELLDEQSRTPIRRDNR
jgi:hypothetical protein